MPLPAARCWRPSAQWVRVVGAFINGFAVADRRFAGSTLDWLTPFNLFCGLGLVVAYLLLGTTWLIMKSEGALQQRMRELTRKVLLALMVVIAVVSVWTPLGWRYVAERWFTVLPVPILVFARHLLVRAGADSGVGSDAAAPPSKHLPGALLIISDFMYTGLELKAPDGYPLYRDNDSGVLQGMRGAGELMRPMICCNDSRPALS